MSTCKYELSKYEFVEPLIKIIENTGQKCEVINYKNIDSANLEKYDKIIISGTALKDFDYLKNINNFNFLKDINKPLFGICAGFEIICSIFGCEKKQIENIGVFDVEFSENKLTKRQTQKAYFIHSTESKINTNLFEVLGFLNSKPCFIKHKTLNIYATTFHPEVYNEELLFSFLNS